jgi:hypothetical protein
MTSRPSSSISLKDSAALADASAALPSAAAQITHRILLA